MAALDALVTGQVPLDEAARVPDHIRAYVARKLSGVNPLENVPSDALGDTDEAAAERCRRLLTDWAREAGIDRVRWIMKVEGNMEADVAAHAAHEAEDLLRLMLLIRHKHRNEPEWDPGTPDEFAGGMLMRQVQDLSMGYRTRGMLGSSWKEYSRLSAATQGKFEGLVMRMVAISHARRSAQVAAETRREANGRPSVATQSESARPSANTTASPADTDSESSTPVSRDQGAAKAWLLADWFVRDFAPVWLTSLGPDDPAVILRGAPELKTPEDLPEAQRRIDRVGVMMNGVTETVGGTAAERDLAADIATECIGGLTDYTNLVTAQGGEALGSIAYQALKLAGIAGTNYLVAGIHSAPPMFRNDPAALRAALRQALQPTVDASNAAIRDLGERLDAAARQGEAAATARPVEQEDPTHAGDAVGPTSIAGRSYAEVIASVKSGLTGDFKHDGTLITSVAQATGDHPQGTEIRRELGRMLAEIAPDDLKDKMSRTTEAYESGFEPGLAEAKARIAAGDLAAARVALEELIGRYGSGTGLFRDDNLTEYRHFANDFEAALYVHLYPSTKHLRKLPQDRATLYSVYGALLIDLKDLHAAEAAFGAALLVNPVSTYALFELGEVMKLSGRLQELRALTLRALEVAYTDGDLGRAYRNLGYLAVEDEDYELAVACYCTSLGFDPERAQAAQSELFYIQQVSGKTLALPDPATAEAILARNGIQAGPSQLVTQLMEAAS